MYNIYVRGAVLIWGGALISTVSSVISRLGGILFFDRNLGGHTFFDRDLGGGIFISTFADVNSAPPPPHKLCTFPRGIPYYSQSLF